jgi:ribonuclease HI
MRAMKKVTIVCDGSSLGNGSALARAGAVAILIYRDGEGNYKHRVVGEYLGEATNNQAEIVAAAIGLEALKYPCDVDLMTDSQYVVQTQLGAYRQKKNAEFWQRLCAAAQPHRVEWIWVRGHNDHPVQEACDRAAKEIAALGWVDDATLQQTQLEVSKIRWPR